MRCCLLDSGTGIVFAHYLQLGRMFEREVEVVFGGTGLSGSEV